MVDRIGMRWLHRGVLERDELTHMERSLAALRAIYLEHIDLEDSVVFVLARELLDRDQQQELAAEMRARRGR